jgi:hypothetical protein
MEAGSMERRCLYQTPLNSTQASETIDARGYFARGIKGTGLIKVSPTGDFQGLLEPMGAVNLRRFNPVEVNWFIKSERDLQYKSIGAQPVFTPVSKKSDQCCAMRVTTASSSKS